MVFMDFGQAIRRRRLALHLSLEALANAAGLTPNYIGLIETGRREPSLSTVLALAKGLGVPPAEIFSGINDLSPPATEAGLLFDSSPEDVQGAVLALLRSVSLRKRQTTLVVKDALLATGTDDIHSFRQAFKQPSGRSGSNIREIPMPDLSTEERLDVRDQFRHLLEERLKTIGWTLASLSLGRAGRDTFIWDITLENAEDVLTSLRIQLAPGAHAYADSTIETIMSQVPNPALPNTVEGPSDAH